MQTYTGVDFSVIKSSDLQRKVGLILKRVAVGGESLIVEREGYPIAALLPYPQFQEAKKFLAHRQLMNFLDSVPSSPYSEEEIEADVLKAVGEVRVKRRRKTK